jgi:hypothetical protein
VIDQLTQNPQNPQNSKTPKPQTPKTPLKEMSVGEEQLDAEKHLGDIHELNKREEAHMSVWQRFEAQFVCCGMTICLFP